MFIKDKGKAPESYKVLFKKTFFLLNLPEKKLLLGTKTNEKIYSYLDAGQKFSLTRYTLCVLKFSCKNIVIYIILIITLGTDNSLVINIICLKNYFYY